MFVKSQDGAVVLNNDKVTEYSTDSKYDGRYKVAALVGENRVVIGRYSTKEKCRMAISMLMDCYTMNLLFERGQDENPRDLYGIRCSRGMPFRKRRLRGLLTISRQNCSDTQTLAEQIQRNASIQPRNR